MADIRKTEDTVTDFQKGTLSGVTATQEGSLELSVETLKATRTETSTADFQLGVLDSVVASNGRLILGEDGADVNYQDTKSGTPTGIKLDASGDWVLNRGTSAGYNENYNGLLTNTAWSNGALSLTRSGADLNFVDNTTFPGSHVNIDVSGEKVQLKRSSETKVVDTTTTTFNEGVVTNINTSNNEMKLVSTATNFIYNDVFNGTKTNVAGDPLTLIDASHSLNVNVQNTKFELPKINAELKHQENFMEGTLTNVQFSDSLQLDGGDLQLSEITVNKVDQDTTQVDFQEGTLNNTLATPTGELELSHSKTAQTFDYTETTEADFKTGTLSGLEVTADGNLRLDSYVERVETTSVTKMTASFPATFTHMSKAYNLMFTIDSSYVVKQTNMDTGVISTLTTLDSSQFTGKIFRGFAVDKEMTAMFVITENNDDAYPAPETYSIMKFNMDGTFVIEVKGNTFTNSYYDTIQWVSLSATDTGLVVREYFDDKDGSGNIITRHRRLRFFDNNLANLGVTTSSDTNVYNSIATANDIAYLAGTNGTNYILCLDTEANSVFKIAYSSTYAATYVKSYSINITSTAIEADAINFYLQNSEGFGIYEWMVANSAVLKDDTQAQFSTGTHTDTQVMAAGDLQLAYAPGITHADDFTTGTLTDVKLDANGDLELAGGGGGGTIAYKSNKPWPSTITNQNLRGYVYVDGFHYYNEISFSAPVGARIHKLDDSNNILATYDVTSLTQQWLFGLAYDGTHFWGALGTNPARIVKFAPDFQSILVDVTIAAFAGLTSTQIYGRDLTFDGNGHIWATIYNNNSGNTVAHIIKINVPSASGTVTPLSYFNFTASKTPWGILHKSGTVYVSDSAAGGSLHMFDEAGTSTGTYDVHGDADDQYVGLDFHQGYFVANNFGQKTFEFYDFPISVAPTGNRVSPPIDLSSLRKIRQSTISWTETVATGNSIKVEVSTDAGVTWTEVTNGGALLPAETDATGLSVQIRETLSQTSGTSPILHDLTLNVDGYIYKVSGNRVSPGRGYVGFVDSPSSSTITWTADVPAGTTLVIQTSVDSGMTWQNVTNGGEVPNLITSGNGDVVTKAIMTSDGTATPVVHDIVVTVEGEVFVSSGVRTSAPIDISHMGIVDTSSISWTETKATGETIKIDVSFDGGTTWSQAVNGQPIPFLGSGVNAAGKTMIIRESLSQTSYSTPVLHDLTIAISSQPEYAASGTRIRMWPLDEASSATIDWSAITPTGTSIKIETSLDSGVTWTEVTNGGSVAGVVPRTTGSLLVRQTLTSTDVFTTPSLHDLKLTTAVTEYAASGNRISPLIDMSSADLVASSTVSWTAKQPVGTSIQVEISTDDGTTWTPVANGGSIPGFTKYAKGASSVKVKQILSTTNTDVTPELHDVFLTVNHYKYETGGSRISQAVDVSNIVLFQTGTLAVTKDVPLNTTVTIETSADGGLTWQPYNTSIASFTAEENVQGKTLLVREKLATTDPYVTPSVSLIDLSMTGHGYEETGTYGSPNIAITGKGEALSGVVTWTETKPTNTGVKVEAKIGTGLWFEVQNGVAHSAFQGKDIEDNNFNLRVTLTSADPKVAPTIDNLMLTVDGGRYTTTGVRTSPAQTVTVTSVASSIIDWTQLTPEGTSINVEVSLDGGTSWAPAVKGQPIPGITKGMDASGKTLMYRTTLNGTVSSTPVLQELMWTVAGGYLTGGSYTTQVIDLNPINVVETQVLAWNEVNTENTSVAMEGRISTDNGISYGAWMPLTSGQPFPTISKGDNLTGKMIQIRATLNTFNVDESPVVDEIRFTAKTGYYKTGSYVTTPMDVNAVGIVGSSVASFTQTSGVSADIRVSVDGGTTYGAWKAITSSAELVDFPAGSNATGKKIQFRFNVVTNNVSTTPMFSGFSANILAGYQTGGTYLSPAIDLTSVGFVNNSTVNWIVEQPFGTTVRTETSVDNGVTWQPVSNGGAIENVNSATMLYIRQTLETSDYFATPVLSNLWALVESGYVPRGERTSPMFTFPEITNAASSKIVWNSIEPEGTSVVVEITTDGGITWNVATNGYIIPGAINGASMVGKEIGVRYTLATQNAAITPEINDLTLEVLENNYSPVGHRIAPPINLDTVGTVSDNTISWIATEPAGTKIEVQAAITNNADTTPPVDAFKPLLIASKTQLGTDRTEYVGSVSQIVSNTELNGLYLWIKEILSTEDVK